MRNHLYIYIKKSIIDWIKNAYTGKRRNDLSPNNYGNFGVAYDAQYSCTGDGITSVTILK